jgi:NADH-quinone oxidoreductase subunit A
LTAMLFIIFDIEAIFIYPWSVNVKGLGWFGVAEMAIFVAVLLVALIYVWRKGALEWGS